jgi:hypothetical protein
MPSQRVRGVQLLLQALHCLSMTGTLLLQLLLQLLECRFTPHSLLLQLL